MFRALTFLLAATGISTALDLTGCAPGRPKEINALLRTQGDLYSPGYKENEDYPNDLVCQYIIFAPYGFKIRVTFEDLDIETTDLCMADALSIHEGIHPMAPVHGVFCGNGTYPPVTSLSNALLIVFRSDFMVGKKGFHIRYHASALHRPCGVGELLCRNRKCVRISSRCDGDDNCGDGTDEENCDYPPAITKCGVRPKNASQALGIDRVIGGKEAIPGSWPWQADLQLAFYNPNGHMCGGTLINSQWVLTAAHCFVQNGMPQVWRVHLGKHRKFFTDRYEQIRMVERIVVFPDVTGQMVLRKVLDLDNDIALMKLNAPVKFTPFVSPACLPKQGYELKVGTQCMATGWGLTRGTGFSHVLKEVELWIEKAQDCDSDMGPIDNKTSVCVRNRKGFQDVCHGDSGGPLVCEINDEWQVMGATSRGTAGNFEGGLCAMPGSYTVYSKVSDKADWIKR
ncbi:Transmembrane protease serine 6, partial [Stegodyphus mimosarum]